MRADQDRHWLICHTPGKPGSEDGECQNSEGLEKAFPSLSSWHRQCSGKGQCCVPKESLATYANLVTWTRWSPRKIKSGKDNKAPKRKSPGGKEEAVASLPVCWRGDDLDWPQGAEGHRGGWFPWPPLPEPPILAPREALQNSD